MQIGCLPDISKAVLRRVVFCTLLILTLSACGHPENAPTRPPKTTVLTPSTGSLAEASDQATIDYTNASEGYVMVKYTGDVNKVKLLIEKGDVTYNYDLSTSGDYEVFPLTMGDGSYKIGVYENVNDAQYAVDLTTTVDVRLSDPLRPYLYPNQYVNFNADSATVKKGTELVAEAQSQLDAVEDIYNYVVENITYDMQKAATVQSGYLPEVDSILSAGKGICFDYAAVMAAMLRTQEIPTRLEVGYVSNGIYHAWISVYTPEAGWVDVIQFNGSDWTLMDPTLASGGGTNKELIGDGTGYSLMYQY
jgi:transglutaminase-like putative cysteine protease